jgi:hypothetical protein
MGAGNGNDETSRQLADALGHSIPGWFAAMAGLSCLQVIGYIAVIVLLAVPVSNAYFRREPVTTWQPPYPQQPYPPYPPQGPYPYGPGSVPPGMPGSAPPSAPPSVPPPEPPDVPPPPTP